MDYLYQYVDIGGSISDGEYRSLYNNHVNLYFRQYIKGYLYQIVDKWVSISDRDMRISISL